MNCDPVSPIDRKEMCSQKPADPIVRLRDAGFCYDDRAQILGGVTFDIPRGELTAIVGPSGCGKSTLLRIIAGLRSPTSGRVERALKSDGHNIAMVFQEDTLVPSKTVFENVDLFFRYNRKQRISKEDRKLRVEDVLRMVGLLDYARYYPGELSGGMRRRVVFASVIISKPELLLLDEPFSAVDEPTRISIHEDVLRTLTELKITAVLVTHDLGEAVSLCSQVMILSRAPARVVGVHDIKMPRDLPFQKLRQTREFLDSYGSLWNELSDQILATR